LREGEGRETRMRGRERQGLEKKQREGGRGSAKIEEEATKAKIIEADQNDIDDEEYVEESNKKRSEREIDTAINRNEEAIYSTYI
jgi:hypothetical protein